MDSTTSRTVLPNQSGTPRPPLARPLPQRLLITATSLLLLGVTAVVGCRVAGTDGITPIPQLLAFLPWLLVPAAVSLLFAALLSWRAGRVWALVLLAVTGWYTPSYATGSTGPRGPVTARVEVLTSNVEFGQATLALIGTIRREKPDLVFVQECEFVCAGLLTDEIPRTDYPFRHIVEAGQAEGSAILSALPLTDTDGITGTLAMPGSQTLIGGRSVRLQLAHPLPPIPGGVGAWRRELGRIRADASLHKNAGPMILAGDFNATRDHAAFRSILDAGGLRDSAALMGAARTPTWPAGAPGVLGAQIDHVLISKEFSVRGTRVLDLAQTDHRSLLVTLDLHAASG